MACLKLVLMADADDKYFIVVDNLNNSRFRITANKLIDLKYFGLPITCLPRRVKRMTSQHSIFKNEYANAINVFISERLLRHSDITYYLNRCNVRVPEKASRPGKRDRYLGRDRDERA